jgi:hypothetical protein
MASTDDRTSDCPIFGLDIILIYLLNVEHSLFCWIYQYRCR